MVFLDPLKKKIFLDVHPTDKRGFFLSTFNQDGVLISSRGLLETDKNIELLCQQLEKDLEKDFSQCFFLVGDLVTELRQEKNLEQLEMHSPKDVGIALYSSDTGETAVLLPSTEGVADMKNALFVIKKRHPHLTGKVQIFLFKTKRYTVSIPH